MFSKEQIKEIQYKLGLLGVKDTAFPVAPSLNGKDTVTIVQDSTNKRATFNAIASIIPSLNSDIVTTSKLLEAIEFFDVGFGEVLSIDFDMHDLTLDQERWDRIHDAMAYPKLLVANFDGAIYPLYVTVNTERVLQLHAYICDSTTIITIDISLSRYDASNFHAVYQSYSQTLQERLTSGINIKTINGNSVLGEGNIVITGGDTGGIPYIVINSQNSITGDFAAVHAAVNNKTPYIIFVNTNVFGFHTTLTQCAAYQDGRIEGFSTFFTVNSTTTNLVSREWTIRANNVSYRDVAKSLQDVLISGTNLKTINGHSLLGSGNIEIQGGSGGISEIPVATNTTLGGLMLGFTQTGKKYPVQLSNSKAFVEVPWTNTEYDDTSLKARVTALESKEDKDTTYTVATSTKDGLMSKEDKAKLDTYNPTLLMLKITQSEYNSLEASGELDSNTIYFIVG